MSFILESTDLTVPINFPQTFLPERRLLAQLLPFASGGGRGDKMEIGARTGIPTGASTGKVEPMIRFAECMGLIETTRASGVWQLNLSGLGQLILSDDPFLGEEQTQWLMHLMLSRRRGLAVPPAGRADAWFALFADSTFRLGKRFTQRQFQTLLVERYGDKGYLQSLAGVVLRSYLEESCLGRLRVLTADKADGLSTLTRQPAPTDAYTLPIYATFLYLVWDELFPEERQVAFDQLARESRLIELLGWNDAEVADWLQWMIDKGLVQVDRYTGTAVLLRLRQTSDVISQSYSGLL